jgi:hypothetical protein
MATIPMDLRIPRRLNSPNGPAFPKASDRVCMNSSESKFYPGANGPFERHVCVYAPAGYAGAELPLIVSADAYGMRYNLPTILDNMIYDQRLPAMAGGHDR